MALLPNGFNPGTLEDALNKKAETATANQNDAYIQQKRRLVGQQAHGGRLMSGVSNYPLADLSAGNTQALSGIQDELAGALSGIPMEDWLNSKNFNRSKSLAELIGSLNKPSTLEQALAGIGTIGPLVATTAAFA